MTLDRIKQIASDRHNLHQYHESSRPLSQNYELIGLIGENKFAEKFDLVVDVSERPSGDQGIDFKVGPYSIDVKTAEKAYNLIVERGKVVTDNMIYVLAKYIKSDQSARLLGWAWGFEVLKRSCRDFGYGIINHYIPVNELHPIQELYNILGIQDPELIPVRQIKSKVSR